MVQMHEKRCIEHMIKLCSDLKLIIESNDVPKKRVRAGEEPEQCAAEESIHESSTELDFPLRWRTCEVHGDKFVIFRPPSESAVLDQLAYQEASNKVQPGLEVLRDQPQVSRVADPGPARAPQVNQVPHVQGPLNGLLINDCCCCICCQPL